MKAQILELLKIKLELSNFLWLEINVPVELEDGIIPDVMIHHSLSLKFRIS